MKILPGHKTKLQPASTFLGLNMEPMRLDNIEEKKENNEARKKQHRKEKVLKCVLKRKNKKKNKKK